MNGRKRPLIVVDPGHGGPDPGAVNELLDLYEKDLNLLLARAFRDVSAGAGFDVYLLRDDDVFLSLQDRARLANEMKADAVLSFHCNACPDPSAEGFEIWTTKKETAADRLATLIYVEFVLETVLTGREDLDDGDPDKEADFYVLRKTDAPAVLVEFGFITNPGDANFLTDPDRREEAVLAVRTGLERWLKERT